MFAGKMILIECTKLQKLCQQHSRYKYGCRVVFHKFSRGLEVDRIQPTSG